MRKRVVAHERHGGGAGGARGPHRRRHSATRRQCRGCRGRGRLCARGDLSARRQSRRRRLHGDPPRRRQRYRDRLSRDRAGGDHRTRPSSMRKAMPIRKNRAIQRSPSACRARSRALRSRAQKYGSGQFTLADLIAPAIEAGARRHSGRADDIAGIVGQRDGAARALAVHGEDISQAATARALARRRSAGAERSRRHARGDRQRRAARLLRRPDRRQDRRRRAGRRRRDDRRRSEATTRAIERTPVRGTYRGYDIVSMPPPSSGGVELIEMLNILEGYDLAPRTTTAQAAASRWSRR